MGNLLKKELKLVLHPMNVVFLALSGLLLAPNYPYLVTFFYTALGVFMMFQTARENRDVAYMMGLPVRKRDMVKARFALVMLIELAQVLCCIPFMWIRSCYAGMNNAVGFEANVGFLGVALIMLGVFHLVFLAGFYKTGYKVGLPFIWTSVAFAVMTVLAEVALRVIPYLRDTCDSMAAAMQIKQIPLLIFGLVVYLILTWLAYQLSVKRFEALDL